jgi:hypothetical protein
MMIRRIRIFNANTIKHLPWPANNQAWYGCSYLLPLIEEGAQIFIDNADVEMLGLLVSSSVVPLVLSKEKAGNAEVCSPYSHYIRYTLEEMAKRKPSISRNLLKVMIRSTALALRAAHIDKVIYVNNWLFATNPSPNLSSSQIGKITCFLSQEYPEHAIVFRSVYKDLHKEDFEALLINQYKIVASRTVYIADPSSKSFQNNDNVKRDLKLLKNSGYEIIDSDQISGSDIPRITKLYRDLYLKKHSLLNPQFNEEFFKLTLKGDVLAFQALRRNGRIDAFSSFYSESHAVTGFVIGYDIKMPQKLGLYRQAFALLINQAKTQRKILNLSSGAGSFKVFRGAVPHIEYDAVYDRHLPYHRQFAWHLIMAGGIFQHPTISRLK